MNRDSSKKISLIAAIMVGVGALLSSGLNFLFVLWAIPTLPRVFILPDPIGWALRPGGGALAILGMLVALIVLVGLTWLFVRMIVRGARAGRGSAVFFGTWGAVIVAAWIAGILRAPLMLIVLRIPAEQTDIVTTQFFQMSTSGVTWNLLWGWLVALVAAVLHRSSRAEIPYDGAYAPAGASDATPQPYGSQPPYSAHQQYPAAPAQSPYPPQASNPPHPPA